MKYKTITIHSFSGDKKHINEPIYKRERERENGRNHLGIHTHKHTHHSKESILKSRISIHARAFSSFFSVSFFLPLFLLFVFSIRSKVSTLQTTLMNKLISQMKNCYLFVALQLFFLSFLYSVIICVLKFFYM